MRKEYRKRERGRVRGRNNWHRDNQARFVTQICVPSLESRVKTMSHSEGEQGRKAIQIPAEKGQFAFNLVSTAPPARERCAIGALRH